MNFDLTLKDPVIPREKTLFHQALFSGEAANVAYYQNTVKETFNAIRHFLESRDTPFSGAALDDIRQKFHGTDLNTDTVLSLKEALTELEALYFRDAIAFHDNRYVAHLNCPVLIPALAAEMIISALNTSMDTWDQSTGATFIELKLLDWTLRKMNYPETADGVFTSGGTQSNLMGLLMGRDRFIREHYGTDPETEGLPESARRFRIFCSEISHFSLKKNAGLLGLGQQAVIGVPVDRDYKMDLHALEKAIKQEISLGNIPIAIAATAGTTDFGSIDPLPGIAGIAREYGLWFHVDAAYGGGLLLSDTHKHKLDGIHLSDSVTIDYHKTFFQPVSSSAFFIRDRKHLRNIQYHADYLNPKEHEKRGIPDMVKKSLQTTRRFDALKLWMTLRTIGQKQLGTYMDTIIRLAAETGQLLRKTPGFEVLNSPEISALVFRYIPQNQNSIDYNLLNLTIKRELFESGKVMVAGTRVKGEYYLKFTLLNPQTTIRDMEAIISLIAHYGKKCLEHPGVPEPATH